jgi:hypothetical protein
MSGKERIDKKKVQQKVGKSRKTCSKKKAEEKEYSYNLGKLQKRMKKKKHQKGNEEL